MKCILKKSIINNKKTFIKNVSNMLILIVLIIFSFEKYIINYKKKITIFPIKTLNKNLHFKLKQQYKI